MVKSNSIVAYRIVQEINEKHVTNDINFIMPDKNHILFLVNFSVSSFRLDKLR